MICIWVWVKPNDVFFCHEHPFASYFNVRHGTNLLIHSNMLRGSGMRSQGRVGEKVTRRRRRSALLRTLKLSADTPLMGANRSLRDVNDDNAS